MPILRFPQALHEIDWVRGTRWPLDRMNTHSEVLESDHQFQHGFFFTCSLNSSSTPDAARISPHADTHSNKHWLLVVTSLCWRRKVILIIVNEASTTWFYFSRNPLSPDYGNSWSVQFHSPGTVRACNDHIDSSSPSHLTYWPDKFRITSLIPPFNGSVESFIPLWP